MKAGGVRRSWLRLHPGQTKALRIVAEIGLIALCLVPIAEEVVGDWAPLSTLASGLNIEALMAAGLLLVLSSLFLPVAMAAFTRGAKRAGGSSSISYRDSALAYYASQPMKYLPGSFWILPGRVMLLRRMGHDSATSSGGLLFEMVTQALSASLVGALLLGASGLTVAGITSRVTISVWLVVAGSLIAVTLLLALPAPVRRIRRMPASIRRAAARLVGIPLGARLASLTVTIFASILMWLIMGLSFYLLLVAGNPRFDPTMVRTAVAVSTVSWLAGFLTPISPGGIGVREAAIVFLLAGLFSTPQATLVAVAARLLALLVETGFAVTAWLILRMRQAPESVGESRTPGRTLPRRRQRRAASDNRRTAGLLPRSLVRLSGL